MVVALIAGWQQKGEREPLPNAWRTSVVKVVPSIITLATAVPMVRVFLRSDSNAGLLSMPMELASMAAEAFKEGQIIRLTLVALVISWLGLSA